MTHTHTLTPAQNNTSKCVHAYTLIPSHLLTWMCLCVCVYICLLFSCFSFHFIDLYHRMPIIIRFVFVIMSQGTKKNGGTALKQDWDAAFCLLYLYLARLLALHICSILFLFFFVLEVLASKLEKSEASKVYIIYQCVCKVWQSFFY